MKPINSVVIFAVAILLFVFVGAFALNIPPTPPVNVEPATALPISPPQPPAPTTRLDEHQVLPETPQRSVESIQPPEPLDKAPSIPPDTPSNPSVKPVSSEMAKMKLMELENAWNKLVNETNSAQSKEIDDLKHTAKIFYDRSVMYYNAGNYRLSLIYSHLSLEIIRAIEEIRR